MDIKSFTNTTLTTTAPNANAAAALSSDFDTFLRLMTAQLQNQDPLNPIDSADYAVQLATFSSVEQQAKTNQLLAGLSQQFNLMGLTQVAGWVGSEARSAAPVRFVGEPIPFEASPDPRADRASLVVTNGRGDVVALQDVPVAGGPAAWDGRLIDGSTAPEGIYALTLESTRQGAIIAYESIQTYARITEVRSGPTGSRLVLGSGLTIGVDEVTALRGG